MEVAAVGIGKAALNCLLSGAKAAIAEDAALTQSVQRDVVFLTDELAAMQSFLRAADEERNRHKVPRSRVRQVRDLAYDVEDCLQEHTVHLEKPSRWRLARTVLERHRVAEEMKGLRARAEDMNNRNLRYHLAEDPIYKQPASSAERSATLGTGAKRQVDLFFESGQVDLIPLICKRDDKELRVIAVWGGSGGDSRKTSVVRRAYEDLKRRNNDESFESYAWIRVVHPFNPSEFLQCTVRQFYMNSLEEAEEEATLGSLVLKKMEAMDKHDLIDEFNKHVRQKRYLVVLNELSTIEDWDWIKTYFPNNKKGSRIIVSTEQGDVASLCAGPERLLVELKQSSTDQTIYAFCEKGKSELGHCSTTLEATDNTDSADGKRLTRVNNSMEDAFNKRPNFIRRQKEISEIIELISKNIGQKRDDAVICICGKDGLGKTALVKSVYQSEELRAEFIKRAYVTIKNPFNSKNLCESLAKQLYGKDETSHDERTKRVDRQRFVRILEENTYLIVLDDLSSTKEWDTIINLFPETAPKASRIVYVVTTCKENIAMNCSKKENIYRLESLEEKDAHNLFVETVFQENIDLGRKYPELDKEADSILKKCNGCPLSISTIGGVLAKRPKTLVEWRKLNEYIGAEIETNPEVEATRTILVKCYDCLPYDLKSCLLYLSIFPKDHIVSRRRLVHRWVAEGYSSDVHGKYAKEIADRNFRELIDRSMIVPFIESIGSTKGIDSCEITNLIHEMSTLKAAQENLVFRLEEGCCMSSRAKIRHLSVSDNWNGSQTEFEDIVNRCSIRSLTVFGKWRPFFISEKMRMLRVLDLEGTSGLNDHHLEHIGKLLQLKYLSLRGCSGICCLPHSLGNLEQLETLDIKHTAIIKLPKAVIRLRKLQYLRAGGVGAFNGRSYEEFVDDMGLPELMRNKLCLLPLCSVACCVVCCAPQVFEEAWDNGGEPNRSDVFTAWCGTVFPFVAKRLDPRGVLVPTGVNKLTVLHTLGTVNISQGKSFLQDIRRLTRLRKLGVNGVNAGNGEEFCSALSALSSLESLSVRSAGEPGLQGCLEFDGFLCSPPEKLKSLKLYGNLVKLPEWISELRNLMKLSLRSSRITDHNAAMQVLGSLPKLSILRMREKTLVAEELCLTFDCQTIFPSLKILVLLLVGDLKSVEFKEGARAMPKLELLQFCGLPSKCKASFFSGLGSLPSLREFVLDDDDYKQEFLNGVQDQLKKNPNGPVLKRN